MRKGLQSVTLFFYPVGVDKENLRLGFYMFQPTDWLCAVNQAADCFRYSFGEH